MSSSLSELRNFRMNKTNGKVATGRKRIRLMSDSSDDDNTKQQSSPQKPTQNGTTSELDVKEKEERYNTFREIVDHSVSSMILQDILVENGWDVQKSFDAMQENPKYKESVKHSPSTASVQSPTASANHSLNSSTDVVKVQKHKKQKVTLN